MKVSLQGVISIFSWPLIFLVFSDRSMEARHVENRSALWYRHPFFMLLSHGFLIVIRQNEKNYKTIQPFRFVPLQKFIHSTLFSALPSLL
jgi:hypothetical protein